MEHRNILFWLVFEFLYATNIFCYDGYNSCSKAFRHSRKMELPCDLRTQSWCTIPGSVYPWHAVRRFVFENHGLMKRMYGEQRHISVLRAEIDDNEVEYGWFNHGHAPVLNRYDPQQTTTISSTSSTAKALSDIITNKTIPTSESPPGEGSIEPEIPSSTTEETTLETEPWPSTIDPNGSSTVTPMTATTYSDETNDDVDDLQRNTFETTTSSARTTSTVSTSGSTASTSATTTTTTTELPLSKPQIFQEVPTYKRKGVNACPVTEEVVAPFWANNTRGEVLALLNMYPFEQYVHWERCSYENKQMYCRKGCRCEQQYRLHRLLAYDPHDDCRGIFSDWFRFPSCCVCKCYDLPSDIRLTSRSPRTLIRD